MPNTETLDIPLSAISRRSSSYGRQVNPDLQLRLNSGKLTHYQVRRPTYPFAYSGRLGTVQQIQFPRIMEIRADDFRQNGLYLLFPDGRRIVLTRERIESFAHTFESNLDEIPVEIRNAVAFQACPVCPEKERAKFCHALPATLAFFQELKGFRSYDHVCAVYRGLERGLVWVPETTMQEALQFVAILSLMYYCEVGKQYWKFFLGTHPLLDPQEMIARLHLNIYWDCRGDQQKMDRMLRTFGDEITCTCRCQVKRLALICKEDALMNAFVNTQAQIECLASSKGALLARSFEKFMQNS